MINVLITGATGNIGRELITFLCQPDQQITVTAAVRSLTKAKQLFAEPQKLKFTTFDFKDQSTFNTAFENIDILFLLRPPHISSIEEYFNPLLKSAQKKGIKKIVFLSVQGAEKSKIIPHNKIESLIKDFNFEYIFLRPSYFMQNLSTTLRPEILKSQSITLPSGHAKFNWIDIKNIAEVASIVLTTFDGHKNSIIELTGSENKSFYEATALLNQVTGLHISFNSINPIRFYFKKKKEGLNKDFALVMTLLHFLPRLEKEPKISNNYKQLTGKKPITLTEFFKREKAQFTQSL
ncbi:NmrA family NAD(P)-binding protein [Pseudotamlana carrageenivorans]|uniref:NmrA-like family protein n=1 Tax=Pseudotamlana carrageenivorans TaxID=2069432 RepID=A0A2I7SJI9_9FLAO|nr:NmrA family NAD(P)-binding protein [Tamlana carrageenivorans]AUS06014.1 NmrA-like family protein [Tamlana carrageenivorans]